MECEMCGSKKGEFKAIVEGTELIVCSKCSSHGKILSRISEPTFSKTKKKEKKQEETSELIVEGYGELVKKSREKKNLTQEEMAKMINEKESVIQSIEREKTEPSISLARKLEKFLKIKLVENYVEKGFKQTGKKEAYTLGDFIKIK